MSSNDPRRQQPPEGAMPNFATCNAFDGHAPNDGMFCEANNMTRKRVDSLYSEVLCQCTKSTAGDAMLMCLALGLRHNLTWVAQVDILKMINSLYGKEVIPATKYFFLKFLERGNENTKMHFYCPSCDAFLGQVVNLPESGTIRCNCGEVVKISDASTYFISIGLEAQFRELLANEDVVQLLRYRFTRKKERAHAMEDIFDGAEYQKHCNDGGILSDQFNFSYSFNTDGVPFGTSSNQTIWPIYVTLNELPPKERAKHVMLAGLWVADRDPNMTNFLQPFVNEANKLSSEGMLWTYQGNNVNSKIIPLCAVVDSVARCKLLNMSQFGAYYGCTFCYQRTEGSRYPIPEIKASDRTHDSTKRDMEKAFSKRNLPVKHRLVKGVKGPSPLMILSFFNIIAGMVPDYMHSLLLGVVRLHTELILESVRKKFWIDMDDDIGMEHLISRIDELLKSIQPPRSITRLPCGLKQMKLWRASEWRTWLVFYCIPCLSGLLKHKHIVHISVLSTAANILLQKSVTREELNHAHTLLLKYVFLFQKYFKATHMVYNVHLLTHLAQAVANWGPLWTQNAFLYEGQNRHLLQHIKSPAFVAQQLVRKFLTYNALPSLCQQLASTESVLEFCEDITGRQLKHLVRCGDVVLVGNGTPLKLSADEEICVAGHDISEVGRSFDKIIYNGIRYSTADYASGLKNNDSVVFITDGKLVTIQKIIHTPEVNVLLRVKEILVQRQPILSNEHVKVTHIKRILEYGQSFVIGSKDIQAQGVLMNMNDNGSFVSKMPYGCYGD